MGCSSYPTGRERWAGRLPWIDNIWSDFRSWNLERYQPFMLLTEYIWVFPLSDISSNWISPHSFGQMISQKLGCMAPPKQCNGHTDFLWAHLVPVPKDNKSGWIELLLPLSGSAKVCPADFPRHLLNRPRKSLEASFGEDFVLRDRRQLPDKSSFCPHNDCSKEQTVWRWAAWVHRKTCSGLSLSTAHFELVSRWQHIIFYYSPSLCLNDIFFLILPTLGF